MCSSSFCKKVAMRMKFVLLCSVAVLSLQLVRAQDIAFPEKEHNHLQVNKDNRQPVFIPGRCAKDEWLYPGDQKDDWVCDCGPGYIYYPAEKKCLAAFRQGPCPVGQYIILKPPAVIPTCEKNPCEEDGMVFFNKGCYKLNAASSACKPIEEGGGTLGVNATTLQLGCISSYSDINIAQRKELYCGPGKKNTILEGNCNRKQPTVQNKEPSILQSPSQQGSQQSLQSPSQQGSQQSSQQPSQQYTQPTKVSYAMQPRLLVGIPIELPRRQPILLDLIQRLAEFNSASK